MYFEGSEKKVEVVVDLEEGASLIALGDEFWTNLVSCCNAKILSSISTEGCKAYLLSESSLFVWKERFTLITCGVTTLANSLKYFLEKRPKDSIQSIIFERKNEHFPQDQITTFTSDISSFDKEINGSAYEFGDLDGHYLCLYHLDKPYFPQENDTTLEILMYDIQDPIKGIFENHQMTAKSIRQETGLGSLFDDFIIDDFKFDPCGYSLNALKGESYYSFHVTPQEIGSYVSFETNFKSGKSYSSVIHRVVEVFKPKSFDVVVFNTKKQDTIDIKNYKIKCVQQQSLNCGYEINYSQFIEVQSFNN